MQAYESPESKGIHIEARDATEDDLEDVVDLWEMLVEHHRTYSDYYTLARDGRKKWKGYLLEKFAEPSTKLIVAEEDGMLIGFMLCLLTPQEPVFAEKAVGIIADAFVMKDRRKRGVMKEMLRIALRWFDKNKIKSVELSIAAANLEGRAAWGQLGFKPFIVRKRLKIDKYHAQKLIREPPKGVRKKVRRRKAGSE